MSDIMLALTVIPVVALVVVSYGFFWTVGNELAYKFLNAIKFFDN